MIRNLYVAVFLAGFAVISQAATVEYWDFEDGYNQYKFSWFSEGGSAGLNGTLMLSPGGASDPSWTNETSDVGGNLAMDCDLDRQYAVVTDGPLMGWSASNWTVELHVKFDAMIGSDTLVGRRGSSSGSGTISDFTLQRKGDGSVLGLNYYTAGGDRHDLSGTTVLQTEMWYGVAAVCDSSAGTVTLYIDSGDGYMQDGQLSGLSGDLGVYPSSIMWLFGCGWGGSLKDASNLKMDNVRFSDTALSITELTRISAGVAIAEHPQDQTVEEGRPATFEIECMGLPPFYVQWYRDTLPIVNATDLSYTIGATSLSDNGAVFYAVVSNWNNGSFYIDISSNAVLTVTADITAPVLEQAISLYPNGVLVDFSEKLDAATATDPANYTITYDGGSLAVTGAEFYDDLSAVLLTTATQEPQTTYTLHVSNVQDLASEVHTIAPDSQVTFIPTPIVDIGGAAVESSASWIFDGGGISGGDVTGGGSGVGGTSDQFSFFHRIYSGSFDVQIRLDAMEFSDMWAQAGLMARDGMETNDVFAAVFATPGPAGCQFMSRVEEGAAAASEGSFPTCFPNMWLRLLRSGDYFYGFAGIDGQTWQWLGWEYIPMSRRVEVGFFLSSGDSSTAITSSFRDQSPGSGAFVQNIALPFEPLGPSSRRSAMVISEIMLDTPSEWGGTNSLEFIELYNTGLITEDLTGFRFSGEVDYTFPDGTMLAPGEFLVIAKDPVAAQSFYGVTCLGPYEGKLSNKGGTLRFRNELDGILLQVEYNDKAPWPIAAFGTGHSMVLSHPSYGEGDPRAWSASDLMGGSPGRTDGYGAEPARGVVINEYLAHTDLPLVDYVELFNTTLSPIDLSGAWLSDEAGTNRYRIADGTTIAARGFLSFEQTELGFALSADGEEIFLVNSNRTRVVDAVAFRGQANGVSEGRYPDGAPEFQPLASVTEGFENTAPLLSTVVINEIMYHPISESNNDEYIELYNRSADSVDLSGWRLQGGISYEFPSNTVINGHGYLVVAENMTNLVAKYSQLNSSNTYGDYDGKLSDRGERIALSKPDDLISTNEFGIVTTNMFYIPVDEVNYLDGGRWGKWSDGGGSSLELIDPDADNRQPANWADSDETSKAPWTSIGVADYLENGQMFNRGRMELFLQGEGEALVDNLECHNNGGPNLVNNGTFSNGTTGWSFGGAMRKSFVENGVGIGRSPALHMVAASRGDTGANKIWTSIPTLTVNPPNIGSVQAWVRWLKGSPYIMLRSSGNWIAVSQRLNVPADCGTPGLPNSQLVANAGPAIYDVTHSPVLPAWGETVVVTARATDPDDVSSMTLNYRVYWSTNNTTLSMLDNGAGGDAVAGDGIYSATIPDQGSYYPVSFYVSADDGSTESRFPATAPERECLIRWGEPTFSGSLGTYRLWVTSDNVDAWYNREILSNEGLDATFVYGNCRVVYNVDTMYSGSPFHSRYYWHPMYSSFPCDYEINFNPGERFLGSEPFVLNAEYVSPPDYPDYFEGYFDETTQVDQTVSWIARKLGQPYNYRRNVHMMINGYEQEHIYMDTQQPNGEMLDEYFPNDSHGELRKIEDWFEFSDNPDNFNFQFVTATIGNHYKSDGGIDVERFRWNWRPRVTPDPDNWDNFTNLIDAVNEPVKADREEKIQNWIDVRNFLRPIATHHICGSWDSYAYDRGKNMYAYKPDNEGWRMLMWDNELAMSQYGSWLTTNRWNDGIFVTHDSTLFNKTIISTNAIPSMKREYLMAVQEAIDGPLAPGAADAILNERYDNLRANGVPVHSPQEIINWITHRRSNLQNQLKNQQAIASFGVDGPSSFTVSTNNIVLTGTAPLQVAEILVNDVAYSLEWTGLANINAWSMAVPLLPGTNYLEVVGVDRFGNPVDGAIVLLTVTNISDDVDPLDAVVINEWMADNDGCLADPADGDYEDWFELYNSGTVTVDLGGCHLTDLLTEPFKYQIPTNGHYTISPGGYLLVWSDGEAAQNSTNLPDLHVSFSLSKSGESIGLYAPDGHEIDTVTFGEQMTDISEGRCPDGFDTILTLSVPTPGAASALPAQSPDVGEASISGSNIIFRCSSVSGLYYQVYYKDDLQDAVWSPLEWPVDGTGGMLDFTHLITDVPHRFYCVGFSFSANPPALSDLSIINTDAVFSWLSVAGQQYQLFYTDDLQDASWTPLGEPVIGTGGGINYTNDTAESSQRFYMLLIQP